MRALVTGYREVDFEDDKGRPVKGINLFIVYPTNNVIGQIATKQWVGAANQKVCAQILGLDFSKPFYADLQYEIIPNSKPIFIGIVPEAAHKPGDKATA